MRHNRWRWSTSFLVEIHHAAHMSFCMSQDKRWWTEGMLGCKRTHTCRSSHTHTHVYAGILQRAAGLRRDEDRHSYSTEKCDLQTLPFARKRKTGQNNRDRLRRVTHTLKDQHRHWHTNISTPLHFFLEFLQVFLFWRSWFSNK